MKKKKPIIPMYRKYCRQAKRNETIYATPAFVLMERIEDLVADTAMLDELRDLLPLLHEDAAADLGFSDHEINKANSLV